MHELCVLDMENKPNKRVGGPDCVVDIDEILFTKRNNNSGLVLVFVTVPNRTGRRRR